MAIIRRMRRDVAVVALALSLLAPSPLCFAASFQPELGSPQIERPENIHAQLRDQIGRSKSLPLGDRVRAAGKRFDELRWQLTVMKGAGHELPDLSEFGWTKSADDTYSINVAEHPEWEMWASKLSVIEDPGGFDVHSQALLKRGFREQDIAMLKEYVTENKSHRFMLDAEISLVRDIKRDRASKATQAISKADAASYVYQLTRARNEARHLWAAGLLQKLDPQRQRILESFYQELGGGTSFRPDANFFDQQLLTLANQIASGEYEKQLIQKNQRVDP